MKSNAPSSAGRAYDIDNLRNLAVLALILFHTGRLFNDETWHIKDAATYPAADLLIGFFNPWHMPLLFLLAGMSAVFALRKRSASGFIGERFTRLLIPFVAGVVLTVLPQVYLERISPYVPGRQSPIDFDGSLLEFVPRFFQMVPYPEGDFSWHHLWFIIYLFLYSIVLTPVLLWVARAPRAAKWAAWFADGSRPFLLVLPIAATELLLRPSLSFDQRSHQRLGEPRQLHRHDPAWRADRRIAGPCSVVRASPLDHADARHFVDAGVAFAG